MELEVIDMDPFGVECAYDIREAELVARQTNRERLRRYVCRLTEALEDPRELGALAGIGGRNDAG